MITRIQLLKRIITIYYKETDRLIDIETNFKKINFMGEQILCISNHYQRSSDSKTIGYNKDQALN